MPVNLVARSRNDAASRPSPCPAMQRASAPAKTSAVPSLWSGTPALLVALAIWALAGSWQIAGAIVHQRPGAWSVIVTAVVILVAALASSIAGFAFSALAGSALAYLKMDPLHAVQTMVLCSTASQLYAVWKVRDSIRWMPLWPMLAAGILTVPLGVWLLRHVDASTYAVGLGLFLTAYGCYAVMRRDNRVVRGNAWVDAVVGSLGGITGGLAGFPGAFVTIWCSIRGWDKLRQRATYQPYILVMQIVTIVCLRWQAPAHASVVQDLAFVPFALLGAIGGLAVFQRLTNKQFHGAVSVLLVVSGVGLLVRGL
jgi:uncharacterized membrane protein YfcA